MLPAPPTTNGSAPPAPVNTKFDLLSGDDFSSPKADNSMALVPVGQAQPNTPTSQQNNSLALLDMFSDVPSVPNTVNPQHSNLAGQPNPLSGQPNPLAGQPNPLAPQLQQQQNYQTSEASFYQNGTAPNMGSSPYVQGMSPAWNGQLPPQQPASPVYGALLL